MDYKSVIEEQIRELQKTQDKMSGNPGYANESCNVAHTIADLCVTAENISKKERLDESSPNMTRTDWDKLNNRNSNE